MIQIGAMNCKLAVQIKFCGLIIKKLAALGCRVAERVREDGSRDAALRQGVPFCKHLAIFLMNCLWHANQR